MLIKNVTLLYNCKTVHVVQKIAGYAQDPEILTTFINSSVL